MKVGDLARVRITSLLGKEGDVVLILEVGGPGAKFGYFVLHQRSGQRRRYNALFLEKIP